MHTKTRVGITINASSKHGKQINYQGCVTHSNRMNKTLLMPSMIEPYVVGRTKRFVKHIQPINSESFGSTSVISNPESIVGCVPFALFGTAVVRPGKFYPH